MKCKAVDKDDENRAKEEEAKNLQQLVKSESDADAEEDMPLAEGVLEDDMPLPKGILRK